MMVTFRTMTLLVRPISFEYGTAGGTVHRSVRAGPRAPVSGPLQHSAEERGLARVLEVLGDDADQPDTQSHRGVQPSSTIRSRAWPSSPATKSSVRSWTASK